MFIFRIFIVINRPYFVTHTIPCNAFKFSTVTLAERFIPLGIHFRGPRWTTENVMTKFGLMHSGKGEIIVAEDSKEWNNGAIKRLRAAASISVPSLFWRVNELQRMIENILCLLQVFSLHVLKLDLYLLKQSIFRAWKRDLERAYLMIVGKSWHFTSCYWHYNLCTAIFYRGACEALIPKNDCRHLMHSSFVRKLFSILNFIK